MADQRDEIAKALMNQDTTGGLTPGDFDTFKTKLNDPAALSAWLDKGGIFGQYGGTPPDPDEQYFGNKGAPSGSVEDVGWMSMVQPWQGGALGGQPGTGYNRSGFTGGGSVIRADPSYWGWQGPHQGYAPGSVGDQSGFNAGRGGGAGGTGGLTPQDFATFSRLISPQALQDWLNAGGVQGQFGGGMGGAAGGGGGGVGGGGGSVGGGGVGGGVGGGLGGGLGGGSGGTLGGPSGGGPSGGGIGPAAAAAAAAYGGSQGHFNDVFSSYGPAMGAPSVSVSNGLAAQAGDTGDGTVGFGGIGGAPY